MARKPTSQRASRRRVAGWPEAAPSARAAPVVVTAQAAALAELREALSRTPRELPCKYLYDDRGSALFEEITRLDEYYPTRTEKALLLARAEDIVRDAGGASLADVIELGSGAAFKTIPLLHAARALGGNPRYVAVDISTHALERTRSLLADAAPGVPVELVHGDYHRALPLPPNGQGPRLALFLGGTIGNDEDEGAIALLTRVRTSLRPGDLLLVGANLVTDPSVIHAAYNDAPGVTAEFNKNLLAAVNAVAGASFDRADFDHHAPYDVEKRRIEMWLVARRDLLVDLGRLGSPLRLARGEGIRTEISRRFTRDEVLRLLDKSGYTPADWFESPDGRFGLALGRARASVHALL